MMMTGTEVPQKDPAIVSPALLVRREYAPADPAPGSAKSVKRGSIGKTQHFLWLRPYDGIIKRDKALVKSHRDYLVRRSATPAFAERRG
jgi:hypothetical protein